MSILTYQRQGTILLYQPKWEMTLRSTYAILKILTAEIPVSKTSSMEYFPVGVAGI
ncbi:MAG: hypothetical protein HF977_02400 [ANME-2 cluster archaeon]|nr:hypothetical protein [ANME-2 cluster archaeon]